MIKLKMVKLDSIQDYIDSISVASKLSGHFIKFEEEEWTMIAYDNNYEKIQGPIVKMIVCSHEQPKYASKKLKVGYGFLIFRFYLFEDGEFRYMNLGDYETGKLTEDIDKAMEILGARL